MFKFASGLFSIMCGCASQLVPMEALEQISASSRTKTEMSHNPSNHSNQKSSPYLTPQVNPKNNDSLDLDGSENSSQGGSTPNDTGFPERPSTPSFVQDRPGLIPLPSLTSQHSDSSNSRFERPTLGDAPSDGVDAVTIMVTPKFGMGSLVENDEDE